MASMTPMFPGSHIESVLPAPWKYICLIEAQFPGVISIGTGCLIGPRSVLTAAHVVCRPGLGVASSVNVTPSVFKLGDNVIRPFNPIVVSSQDCKVRSDYLDEPTVDGHPSPRDYALLRLPDAPNLGYMGLAILGDGYFNNPDIKARLDLHLAGYPVEGGVWGDLQSFDNVADGCDDKFVTYKFETTEGESGAGLFYLYDHTNQDGTTDQLAAVTAVHIYMRDDGLSRGVRLTQSVYNDLLLWRTDHPS